MLILPPSIRAWRQLHFVRAADLFCVQKERKLLQVKRLDLDAAKTKLKKARMADARAAVSRHTHTPSMHLDAFWSF